MASVQKRSNVMVFKDVVFAIFLREIKRQSSDKIGVVWSVVSPVTFILMLSLLRGRLGGDDAVHGIPTFIFMLIGMILVQSFLGTFESASRSIKVNKPLYAFRQVQPIASVIALTTFELLTKLFVTLTLCVIVYFLQIEWKLFDPLGLLGIVLAIWLTASCLGLIFALAICYVPEIDKIRTLITRPLFFISGIFFSLNDIPQEYWPYLTWNPLLHAVELSRGAAYPIYNTSGVSGLFLGMFTLITLSLSLSCYHIIWKQAISR